MWHWGTVSGLAMPLLLRDIDPAFPGDRLLGKGPAVRNSNPRKKKVGWRGLGFSRIYSMKPWRQVNLPVRQACTFPFPGASRGDGASPKSCFSKEDGRKVARGCLFLSCFPQIPPFSLDTSRYHSHSNQILLCEAPPVSTTLPNPKAKGLCECVGVCLRELLNRQKPLRTGTLK